MDVALVLENHTGLIKKLVYSYTNKIPGSHHDFNDFYQEALYAVIKALPRFDEKLSKLSTFICMITRNKLHDIMRREIMRLNNLCIQNFSAIESRRDVDSLNFDDAPLDFPVDMPVDAMLIEREMFEELERTLPEDQYTYLQVCLNPPDEMIQWINEQKRKAGQPLCKDRPPKKHIVEYLESKGEKKWATTQRKLNSALMNQFPDTLRKRFKRSTTTSCSTTTSKVS